MSRVSTDGCSEITCPHHGRENRRKLAEMEAAKLKPPCRGFRWIGQSFAHCDRCGAPYWEHAYDEEPDRDAGPFAPNSFKLVPISPEQAEACRRKWGGAA